MFWPVWLLVLGVAWGWEVEVEAELAWAVDGATLKRGGAAAAAVTAAVEEEEEEAEELECSPRTGIPLV